MSARWPADVSRSSTVARSLSDADGARCPVTSGLEAAHITPYVDKPTAKIGVPVCPKHRRLIDQKGA